MSEKHLFVRSGPDSNEAAMTTFHFDSVSTSNCTTSFLFLPINTNTSSLNSEENAGAHRPWLHLSPWSSQLPTCAEGNTLETSITKYHDNPHSVPRRVCNSMSTDLFKEQILLITGTKSLARGLIRQLVNEWLSMTLPPITCKLCTPPLPPLYSLWRLFNHGGPEVLHHSLV